MDQEEIYQFILDVQKEHDIQSIEEAIQEVSRVLGISDDEVSDYYYDELLYRNESQLQFLRKQQIQAIESGEDPEAIFSLLRFLKQDEIHNEVFAYIESLPGFNKYRKYKAASKKFDITVHEAREKWAEGFFHIPLIKGITKKKNS